MRYRKYHGLGNDYLVIDPAGTGRELTTDEIRRICHRNYGPGSDGILWGPLPSQVADFALRIFNPDGSEAEKSGNGLRIFARYLYDERKIGNSKVAIETSGGVVKSRVFEQGRQVEVEMGSVSFESTKIPVLGPPREVLDESMVIDGQEYRYSAATIGNPHCVITSSDLTPELARSVGPVVERERRFPKRTNVQFMKVLDRANIRIEIWERGAGYTLASGSSSCAAAAVARKLGHCDGSIAVHMLGGVLDVTIDDHFSVTMRGAVTRVNDGNLCEEAFLPIDAVE